MLGDLDTWVLRAVLGAVAIGVGASGLMDLWNLFLRRAFGIPSLNVCLLGRWLRHLPGTLRHASISAAATPQPTQARLKSLATHTVFGIGLHLCALGVRCVLRPL